MDALAAILGDKPWFFGDEPTETDAVAYGQLANIHSVGFSSPMKAVIAGHANLVSFIERFAARYYP
ncbi:MAG: glutathione S-transferase C-terminal domain-containing protein [Haliea sp.]|nr:glutathione S-transferase C-terminal domain-containing protein [Haliea sp.]